MKRSAIEYILEDDFEGALERFENASNKRWINYWFDVCQQIANNNRKEFAKKYIFDSLAKTIVKKIADKRQFINWQDKIIVECDLLDQAKEKCYLFEFYDSQDNLVCSKIGTTTRKVIQRIKEEMKSKTYINLDCTKAIIKRVYDCGSLPADGMKSYFRAHYIKIFPQSFKKNDRFMKQYFDFEIADNLMQNYLQKGLTN